MTKASKPIPPGEGERRAQRGYVPQYDAASAAIYAALDRDDLVWIGLADRGAGIADDVVLGLSDRIVGHQFKTSKYPDPFRLESLLLGADGLFQPLVNAWGQLRQSFPGSNVEIRLVTNDIPSNRDKLIKGSEGHSAAFIQDFKFHPSWSLNDWRLTRWQPFVDKLAGKSGLSEEAFNIFFGGLRILCGSDADFVHYHRLSPEGARLARKIADLLPRLVADARDRDRWTRAEFLKELNWPDSSAIRRSHQFPVGAYAQRNYLTEGKLREAINAFDSGYVSLVGPPGSGKSTLLQLSLTTESALVTMRYLAFVPGEGQGVGRGEAEGFLDDLNAQFRRSGLAGIRFRNSNLHERREQFGSLLNQAGERFRKTSIRTLIIVDGLDHIPREERPERSLLAELPLPESIPAGVIFVLGTQRLDLDDLKPAIQEQASLPRRHVIVEPLAREAVYRMADAFGLGPGLSRERLFALCHGHPLVTRYLIEALLGADSERQEALLKGEFDFEGDIETVYASAWRDINDDSDARDVLGYIARAEGPIPPELLARAVSDQAVERALASTRHLLSLGPQGWEVFHNSFRLFILSKPRLKFGKQDLDYSPSIYRNLAELARIAGADSHQRWLELRYWARAESHSMVLSLAQPTRFRNQLSDGRSSDDIQADIRLAFGAAKALGGPIDVFRLLLAMDEVKRRSRVLEYAPGVVDALLAIGDIDSALAYTEANGSREDKVVDALLSVGEIDKARAVFHRNEPLEQLLGSRTNDLYSQQEELHRWAEQVFHFRDSEQINEAIERLTRLEPDQRWDAQDVGAFGEELRLTVAQAAAAAQPDSDPCEIARQLKVQDTFFPYLLIEASLRACKRGLVGQAHDLLLQAVVHSAFLGIPNGWRRRAAMAAVELGDTQMARSIFANLVSPGIAMMDGETGGDVSEGVVRAVIAHAELTAMLGEPLTEGAPSKRSVLRPLQHHARVVGAILGRTRVGDPIAQGEVARATRDMLTYLEHARPDGPDEFYAIHQISFAAPVLVRAFLRAAAISGEAEFAGVIAEFDRSFLNQDSGNYNRISLRREVASAIYRWNGDVEAACQRLEPLVAEIKENTPEAQAEELASLATAFAHVGNEARARDLIRQIHRETLGYALAPKKDPQFEMWEELFQLANAANPDNRRERVGLIMRQLAGMAETEGRSSAYRISASVLTEAAMVDASTGYAAARIISKNGVLGWDGILNALLLGVVRRRPDLAGQCAITWMSLSLPYYREPHYRPGKLGEIISAIVAAANESTVAALVETLCAAIEAESQLQSRAALLERLAEAASPRNITITALNDALVRWQAEAPAERDVTTPMRFDDVASLDELEKRFLNENVEHPNYEGVHAYVRLAPNAGLAEARDMFERWPAFQEDARARFTLVEQAFRHGDIGLARSLVEAYPGHADDRASWDSWSGAGKLNYYQGRLKLDGALVHRKAFNDLVEDLAAGRGYTWSILLDHEAIFRTITPAPDWPAMWECLAEQLRTTREHAFGKPFEVSNCLRTDEELIVELHRWALSLALPELRRHFRDGALRLLSAEGGAAVFELLARTLLQGDADEPIEGMQLLLSATDNMAVRELGEAIASFADHPDYAVAVGMARLSRAWGRPILMSHADLPPLYQIHLDENRGGFERPTLIDPISGAMRVEDPLGWTFPFSAVIKMLSRKGVSIDHIRLRCRELINSWGGLEVFGQAATDKLKAELACLDMRLTYSRPHTIVAARAIRYVAGEMRRAGLINERDEPWLLHMMDYPAVRLPNLRPTARPPYIQRPSVDRASWTEEEQRWMNDVHADVQPLLSGGDTVIAEIVRFNRRYIRKEFTMERMRAPFLDIGSGGDLFSWVHKLPEATWIEGWLLIPDGPATTIVRRFSESFMPGIPSDMLVICPLWLDILAWQQHPENWMSYIDRTGRIVAKVLWWRDGGPVDIGQDNMWGEGFLVIVTPEGRAQIDTVISPLTVKVHARRTHSSEGNPSAITDQRASSVE
ncbi:P-loop NTPase family protein [Mesoterricola sediminis]|uniref:Uncharacterized protein n=1 Tax=Mesoterricola sediminis TaxID=2927980 RepID=A0AA48KCA8_9BACT|nr:hypothetical protein [Mesoterricola sediminis]BDU76851.1 hypothetical protein METESE_18090 [Mesoterricola sediminis]